MPTNTNYTIAAILIAATGYAGFRIAESLNTKITASSTFSGGISASRDLSPVIKPIVAGAIGTIAGMACGAAFAYQCKSEADTASALWSTFFLTFIAHNQTIPTYSRPAA